MVLFAGCKPAEEPFLKESKKLNIVLIVVDDLGYGDLGSYGNTRHETPHMDRLAATGMVFNDFHANGPVCSPTRAALMTGQYQQRSGIESAIGFVKDEGVPLNRVTIAEILSEGGYICGLVGKWHLGHVDFFGPNDQGFAQSYTSNNSPDYHSHVSRNGEVDWYKDHRLFKETGYLTNLVAEHSNAFIEENKEAPFFLYVSHLAVHFPFQGPQDPAFRTTGSTWHGNERIPGRVQPDSKYGPLPPEGYNRAYGEMLKAVDESVGSVVSTLEALNLRENTLIIITSDNGAYSWVGSNGPFRGQKGDLFEGGHRVPAIFNWPGKIEAGSVSAETTITMDLAPTMVNLAGINKLGDWRFDGLDLSDPLLGRGSLPARKLFWRFNNSYTNTQARAVRHGDWKYVLEGGKTYLFNLASDPGEQINLAPENKAFVEDLEKAFLKWEKEVTDWE